MLGFNDTSSLVGHFVSSPREKDKRDGRDSGGDERKGLIVLGFNNTSTLVGHFVPSPREREKRDSRDSRRDEEIKTFTLYP